MRSETLSMTATPKEAAVIRELARRREQSISDFLREAVRVRVVEVMRDLDRRGELVKTEGSG